MPNHTHYTDFLKDQQFIRWQLLPDEPLNSYWDDFVKKHPELKDEMQQAVTYLKKKGLHKSNLSDRERTELLHTIETSIRHNQKSKLRRLIGYSSAAVSAVALIITAITLFRTTTTPETDHQNELIVGEMLHSEDIQLITSEEAIRFQSDVEVTLNGEGKATVTPKSNAVKIIDINQEKLNSLIVPYGKRSSLTLADGSRVWLNSGSVLEFPATFSGKKREIRLASGEMYIKVSPDSDKPFYVHTSNFEVKVYGTAFNLSAYDDQTSSIVLVEGSVALKRHGDKEEMALRPNELASYDSQSGSFNRQPVDVNNYISWRKGYLTLDKTPMTELLQRIERYYNLSFNYEQDVHLQQRTCTGKIYLSEDIDNVMTTIALLSSTRYEINKNRIYITNETD